MVACCKRAQERGSNSKRKTNGGIKTSSLIKVEAKGHRQGENQAREQAKVKRYQTVINKLQSRNKKPQTHLHTTAAGTTWHGREQRCGLNRSKGGKVMRQR